MTHADEAPGVGGRMRVLAAVVVAIAGMLGLPHTARAQGVSSCGPGDLEVRSLDFSGNKSFSEFALASAIVTTESSWPRRFHLWFGTKRCLDHPEFVRDITRLRIFYRNHGFPRAAVDTSITQVGTSGVGVTFRIDEGRPLIVDSLTVSGLDSLRNRKGILSGLPLRRGGRFDLYDLSETTDTIQARLHNSGYPDATLLQSWSTDTVAGTASVNIDARTGRLTRLGAISVKATPLHGTTPDIPPAVVKALSGLHEGSIYRERELVNAQRTLYQTDAFRHIEISLDTTRDTASAIVPVSIRADEGYMHQARLGGGWGTLDCVRTQGQLTDRQFLSGRARLDLSGRVSKIGIGKPLGGAPWLCPKLRDDIFSKTLNYYGSATIHAPVLFGLHTVPTVTLYSERRSEAKVYLRTTPIGALASLETTRPTRLPSTVAYQLEYGRTDAEPSVFCALFSICDATSREKASSTKRLAIASYSVTRNRSDDQANPTRGTVLQLEARHASHYIGSDPALEFSKLLGDGSIYVRLGHRAVLALRARAGGVFTASDTSFTPLQERLYAGGPNTVRGFRQNELGPIVYTAAAPPRLDTFVDPISGALDSAFHDTTSTSKYGRAVPTGGNTMVVGNIELRLRSPVLPDLIEFTLFDDVGQVWNRGEGRLNLDFSAMRWTPGLGVRVFSPVGALRMDVGYNKYGLPNGPLFYAQSQEEGSGLPCTSPGNTIPVHLVDGKLVQDPSPNGCIASFLPSNSNRFYNRLTFNFSIGQAF